MTSWICIGWKKDVKMWDSSAGYIHKRVEMPDHFLAADVMREFKKKFPGLRNQTVHREKRKLWNQSQSH